MSSVKTAQIAAEEYANERQASIDYCTPWENRKIGFEDGITWAKSHDPDVLGLVAALTAIGKNAQLSPSDGIDPIRLFSQCYVALENYRKSTEAK